MTAQGKTWGMQGVAGGLGVIALSAAALALCATPLATRISSAGHTYVLPASSEVTRTLLPDGRTFEVHGAQGHAYVIDGATRHRVSLPEVRRFASVTVMPSGQVLLWGGIDGRGQVLDTGEWFEPSSGRFAPADALGLPARAGHTLTVLTDGRVLMTGGWSAHGVPATEALLWQPTSRQSMGLVALHDGPRLTARAQIQADGSVRIEGGVDVQGHAVPSTVRYDPADATPDTPIAATSAAVVASLPIAEATAAPIQGPLALRFSTPVDVRQLNPKTVTLLGPEGAVSVHVTGAEGGRLAFVQLPDDLYPGSRYTLFVKGLHTATGIVVPYKAIGFTTARATATGVVVAGQGGRPQPSSAVANEVSLPPLVLMTGNGRSICVDRVVDSLCREHSVVRDGAWYPGRDNAPDATGGHWRLYRPHQSLPDTRAREAELAKGATALIGQVRQIDETPVANVEVSVGDLKARTDAQGVFVLAGLRAGRQEVFVDGRTASHGEVQYGRFLVGANIQAKAIGHMPFVMYLPRVLPRDEITLPSPTSREVVLTHPDMPGLELHVPAGTVFKDREGHVLTHIAIVPTPVDHAPFPLPDNFPMYFTIQPGDAVVEGLTPEAAKGIRVVYPNYGHAKANTAGNFWVYGVKEGWQMYGSGHITADAKQLAPDPGVALVWALGAGASLSNAYAPTAQTLNNQSKGCPIDLQTGIMFHQWNDLSINDIMPLSLTRAYSSADSNSHMFGVGGNSNYGIHLYSRGLFTTPQLVLPCGQGIAFNLVSGSATSWPLAGDVWEHTATNSAFYGATLQFFTGTAIGEYWQITLKDGSAYGFQSDVPNQLKWMRDRYGNQVQLAYNGGLIDQVTSPSGRSITFNYDSSNRVTSAVDNTNRTVGYAYNPAGSLATVTYPDKTTEQYTYDSNHRMLTMQDRRGTVWVTNQYDTNGRVFRQTFADSTYYQFGYTTDSNNNVTATLVTDPNGNQEQVAFDPTSHYPATDTYGYGTSLAQTTTYVREPSGLIDNVTDALGRTTAYTYDVMGDVTGVTRLYGTTNAVTYQFTYTPDSHQLASVTDPLGHVTTYGYAHGCLNQMTDPLGHGSTIQCNSAGQPVTLTDALGHVTTLSYQGYDLQSITDPLGRTMSYTVDALGRPIATQDPLGNVTLTQYDVDDRVSQVTDALNQTTILNYDGNSNLLSTTLPSGAVIATTYDARNRPHTRTDALNQSESWTYDGMNHVLSHTDRKGQATIYGYDALNRPALTTYADGSTTQPDYDAANRLTGLVDSSSGNLSWGYDGLDRATTTVTPQGTIGYTYDASGRRTSMTPAMQAIVNYFYDNANRLTSLTQGSETVQLGYDNANRRNALTLPNGVSVSYGYDAGNQLTGLSYAQGNGTVLGNLAYGYDNDGRRTGQSGSLAPNVLPTPSTRPGTFDLNNRQTSFNGTTQSFDANGNLTSNGINTFVWNARNQLTQITQGGTTQFSYAYDALGRRTSKSVAGAAAPTTYLYDGMNAVQEVIGNVTNPILTGLGTDERYARNDVNGRTDFLTDALGSTIALTDPTGAITQQYSYDPYGNVTQSNTTTGFTNPYLYTGREADSTGLYYYRARYYSPTMGRFISEDPMGFGGGQLNFYAYVAGNPLGYRDPSGRFIPEAVIGAGIGLVFGVVNGVIAGDYGNGGWSGLAKLGTDGLAGAGSGALIGLTDGMSLVGGIAARSVLSAGIEVGREAITSEINGCLKFSNRDITGAAFGSAFGDLVGAAASSGAAADAIEQTGHMFSEGDFGVYGTTVAGVVAGAIGSVVSGVDRAEEVQRAENAQQ